MWLGDRNRADLLLVIGTSLQVAPVSKVMGWLPSSMPQILINRDVVAPPRSTSDGFDVSLIGAVASSFVVACECEAFVELVEGACVRPAILELHHRRVCQPADQLVEQRCRTLIKLSCNCVGDADLIVAHLAEEAGIPIAFPDLEPASSRHVKAKPPVAMCMRGAVWAPQIVDPDTTKSSAFVSVSSTVAAAYIQ